MSWTDERVALLKKMWSEGKSAAEIAKILGGGLTRNAVIGKAHRLKLSNRISPIQQNSKKTVETTLPRAANAAGKGGAHKKIVIARDADTDQDAPSPRGKTGQKIQEAPRKVGGGVAMVNLRDRMCRWPEGDPKEPGFSFCGEECVTGLPYCDHHAKIAYQAPSRSRTLSPEDFEREGAPRYDLDEELKEAAASV